MKSKRIGLIAEDKSDIAVVNELLSKYLDQNSFATKKFVGNGCGKIMGKCQPWVENLIARGCSHVLVFHDLDRKSEVSLRRELEKRVAETSAKCWIVVIPIEELEAWLLTDSEAIKAVFSLEKAPPEISECEKVSSPKEYLERLVWRVGRKRYLNTTHNAKIARHSSLTQLKRCGSYRKFDDYVTNKIVGGKA